VPIWLKLCAEFAAFPDARARDANPARRYHQSWQSWNVQQAFVARHSGLIAILPYQFVEKLARLSFSERDFLRRTQDRLSPSADGSE